MLTVPGGAARLRSGRTSITSPSTVASPSTTRLNPFECSAGGNTIETCGRAAALRHERPPPASNRNTSPDTSGRSASRWVRRVVGHRQQIAEPPLIDLVHQPLDRDRDAHTSHGRRAATRSWRGTDAEPGLRLEIGLDDRSILGIVDLDRVGQRQLGPRLVGAAEAGQRPRRRLVDVGVIEVGSEVAGLARTVRARSAGVVQRQLALAEHGVATRDEPRRRAPR